MYSAPSRSHSRQPSPRAMPMRERRIMQHGPRIAAGHNGSRLDEAVEAPGIALDVGFLRLGERRVDIGIAQLQVAHGVLHRAGRTGSVPVGRLSAQPHTRLSVAVIRPAFYTPKAIPLGRLPFEKGCGRAWT